MTDQEIFDKVLNHLRAQGHRATNDAGKCVYRASNGDMCAVGCLIADGAYKADMEGGGVYRLLSKWPSALGLTIGPHDHKLLQDLQAAHDVHMPRVGFDSPTAADWECEMEEIARKYGLVYTPQGKQGETA